MRNFWKVLSLLLIPAVCSAVDLQPQTTRDYSCGLVTVYDAAVIGDGCSPDLKNVDVWTGRIEPRRGSVLQNATPLTGDRPVRLIHEYVDLTNNFWLITVSSNSLFASNSGGSSNSILTSTHGITSASEFSAVNAFGKVRLTDGTTNWLVWDGTTLTISTASPKGKTALFAYERIWTSSGSTLYASRFGDPEDWTDDGVADNDAFSENIRQNDGYKINALHEWRGHIYVFKAYSLDSLSTTDGLTFSRDSISNTKGTFQPRSIRNRDNDFIFLADDGFYKCDGVSIQKISDVINPTVLDIGQRTSAEGSIYFTNESELNDGTMQYTTTTISVGSVVLSSVSLFQTSFDTGTYAVGISSSVSAGSIVSTNTVFETFDTGSLTWASAVSNAVNMSVAQSGGNFVFGYSTFCDDAGDCEGVATKTPFIPSTTTNVTFQFHTLTSSSFGENFKVYIGTGATASGLGSVNYPSHNLLLTLAKSTSSVYTATLSGSGSFSTSTVMTSNVFDGNTHDMRLSYNGNRAEFRVDGNVILSTTASYSIMFDTITFYGSCTTAGGCGVHRQNVSYVEYQPFTSIYTSKGLDLGEAVSHNLKLVATDNAGTGSINYVVYTDNDVSITTQTTSTYISSQTVTNGAEFTTPAGRYLFYQVAFGNLGGVTASSFDDLTITGKPSTGTYLIPVFSNNGTVGSWGPVTVGETLNGGTLAYSFYTDTDTVINPYDLTTFTSSQSIVNGQTPSLPVATFASVRATFTITSSIHDPAINDIAFTWSTSDTDFPVASLFHQGDYMCAVAIDSTTVNDTILVYDRNERWTKYKDLQAYSMNIYRQNPYYGSSSFGDIFRFQVDDLNADNGISVDSYWVSKEFDWGFPITDKTMQAYYITANYRSQGDVDFNYGVNRGSLTSTSLDLDAYSGLFRKSITPSSLTYSRGISHRFKFSNNDGDFYSILSVTPKPRLETDPF